MLEAARTQTQESEVFPFTGYPNVRPALNRTLQLPQSDKETRANKIPKDHMGLLKEEMAEFAKEYSESQNPAQDDYDALNKMAGCKIECDVELDPSAIIAIRDVYQKILEIPNNIEDLPSLKVEGYLLGHLTRVGIYSALIAQKLNENANDSQYIEPALAATAGFLHDIGKMHKRQRAISETEGRLTDEQYEEMKEHPEFGAKVLRYLKNYEGGKHLPIGLNDYRAVYNAILNHHVRCDGGNRSYPQYVDPSNTSRLDGIVSVADSFDAMTSNRSYNKNRGNIRAQIKHGYSEVEQCAGTQFNPVAANAFCGLRPMPRFDEVALAA